MLEQLLNFKIEILIGLNYLLTLCLFLGLRRRPRQHKAAQGRIIAHKFITRKIKK